MTRHLRPYHRFAKGSSATLIAVFLIASVLYSVRALAGDVTGRVVLGPTARTTPAQSREASRQRLIEEWNGFVQLRDFRPDPSRELAVVLTGSGNAVGLEQPFLMRNGNSFPYTWVIRPGAPLRIRNADGVTYHLQAAGLAEFEPAPTPPESVREINIEAPGQYAVSDADYPHVRASLHVIPDLVARAEFNAEGQFVFRGVPAGSYQLCFFAGEREVSPAQTVTIVDGNLQLEPVTINSLTGT